MGSPGGTTGTKGKATTPLLASVETFGASGVKITGVGDVAPGLDLLLGVQMVWCSVVFASVFAGRVF